jgi:hypothetical protein
MKKPSVAQILATILIVRCQQSATEEISRTLSRGGTLDKARHKAPSIGKSYSLVVTPKE